jgi:hypothetical protein
VAETIARIIHAVATPLLVIANRKLKIFLAEKLAQVMAQLSK